MPSMVREKECSLAPQCFAQNRAVVLAILSYPPASTMALCNILVLLKGCEKKSAK
jgi:hypothetical protein